MASRSSFGGARSKFETSPVSGYGNAPMIEYDVEYERCSMGNPGSLAITITECKVRPS